MSDTRAAPSREALERLIAEFQGRRPLRAGSLIVTVFGDAIASRGGELWLGSLLEIMALFGVDGGLVRTALSRLVAEGWLERTRAGRNSFYRLSATGMAEFSAATQRIYHSAPEPWDGRLRVAILSALDGEARAQMRDRLLSRGFGQAAPTVLLRPAHPEREEAVSTRGVVWLDSLIERQPDAARILAETCWQLGGIADAYRRFGAAFGPLAVPSGSAASLGGERAFQLRVLLIHEYRRVILRDPMLPREMLPPDWPGHAARQLCARLYREVAGPSERWLTARAQHAGGALPAPDPEFARRFAKL